jgi:hypothetical protein
VQNVAPKFLLRIYVTSPCLVVSPIIVLKLNVLLLLMQFADQ